MWNSLFHALCAIPISFGGTPMRYKLTLLLPALFILTGTSCYHSSGSGVTGRFDYLFFVRQGGGDKIFTVSQEPSIDGVLVLVTRYQFRDTTVRFIADRNQIDATVLKALDDALYSRISIQGDFHQPTQPTGTWAHLYMVRAGERFEITNPDLRNGLLPFEALVENKLNQPH